MCVSCASIENTADTSNDESRVESVEIRRNASEKQSVQTITIKGCAINDAGIYIYREGMTLEDALSDAGGVTNAGSKKAVNVSRIIEGERLQGKLALDDMLMPDDVVVAYCTYF